MNNIKLLTLLLLISFCHCYFIKNNVTYNINKSYYKIYLKPEKNNTNIFKCYNYFIDRYAYGILSVNNTEHYIALFNGVNKEFKINSYEKVNMSITLITLFFYNKYVIQQNNSYYFTDNINNDLNNNIKLPIVTSNYTIYKPIGNKTKYLYCVVPNKVIDNKFYVFFKSNVYNISKDNIYHVNKNNITLLNNNIPLLNNGVSVYYYNIIILFLLIFVFYFN